MNLIRYMRRPQAAIEAAAAVPTPDPAAAAAAETVTWLFTQLFAVLTILALCWWLLYHLVDLRIRLAAVPRRLAYLRIQRLEIVAARHFSLSTSLGEYGPELYSLDIHSRLALAAANAAWDLRRRYNLEETP